MNLSFVQKTNHSYFVSDAIPSCRKFFFDNYIRTGEVSLWISKYATYPNRGFKVRLIRLLKILKVYSVIKNGKNLVNRHRRCLQLWMRSYR